MPGQVVELDDALAVGGVGELQVEDFGVFLGLLQALAGLGVVRLGLDDGDGKVNAIAKNVVGAFAGSAAAVPSGRNDSAVGERDLFVDPKRLVVPARRLQLGHDVAAAGICFVGHFWL